MPRFCAVELPVWISSAQKRPTPLIAAISQSRRAAPCRRWSRRGGPSPARGRAGRPARRGGERHLLGDLGGGLTDQAHVLDEDGQRRADVVEVTVDHALAAVAEHEGGGRA